MSPDDLTPSVVVYWLRKQATRYTEMSKKFTEAAQALESASDSPASPTTPSATNSAPLAGSGMGSNPAMARPRLASPLNKAS